MKLNSLALVIAEPFVKRAYPGGVRGFLHDQASTQGPNQRVVRSGKLVAVIDDDTERLVEMYARIKQLTGESIDAGAPCVLVDPLDGLIAPCDWLSFKILDDGQAEIRYTGRADVDPPTVPAAAPEAPVVAAPPPPPEVTLIRLAESGGRITWLDTSTGRQLVSEAITARAIPEDDAPRPMLDAASAMLESHNWKFARDDDGDLSLSLDAGALLVLDLRFVASRSGNALMFAIRLPGCIAEDRRKDVCQYLMGANWLLEVGGFDMDLSDGEIVYRAGIIAPDGLLRPSTVEIAMDRSVHTVRYYAAGLIEVARGADPREVLERVEGK